jgi:hypothetical protein
LSDYNDVDVTEQVSLVYCHMATLSNGVLDNTAYAML